MALTRTLGGKEVVIAEDIPVGQVRMSLLSWLELQKQLSIGNAVLVEKSAQKEEKL